MHRIFIVAFVSAILVCALLVYRALETGAALVLEPAELLKKASAGEPLQRIRVAGRVLPDGIAYQIEPQARLEFSITAPEQPAPAVRVLYRGVRPDMFAPGRDVLIDGEYRDGVLVASNLLTQCPSKYEPPMPSKVYSTSTD